MKVHVTTTPIAGLLIVNIDFFRDERGFFIESWHKKAFAVAGVDADFMQDSHSRSTHRVLRGLHYQDMRAPLAKLVRCTVGNILDVAVDLRASSPTFGKWFSIELNPENKTRIIGMAFENRISAILTSRRAGVIQIYHYSCKINGLRPV